VSDHTPNLVERWRDLVQTIAEADPLELDALHQELAQLEGEASALLAQGVGPPHANPMPGQTPDMRPPTGTAGDPDRDPNSPRRRNPGVHAWKSRCPRRHGRAVR
jgi:hypothetical protein